MCLLLQGRSEAIDSKPVTKAKFDAQRGCIGAQPKYGYPFGSCPSLLLDQDLSFVSQSPCDPRVP